MTTIFKRAILASVAIAIGFAPVSAKKNRELQSTDPAFLTSSEAARIGDQVIAYQRVTGGWPKNIDMAREMTADELAKVIGEKERTDDSTTDNGATNLQINFLANLYKATGEDRFANAVRSGIEYLLSGQYDNGGWPQFWPDPQGYQIHITYNDNAMVNTMNLLKSVAMRKAPFDAPGLVTDDLAARCIEAFNKGVKCTLDCQIQVDGQRTVWCQQHDRETYAPAPARAYELPSYCSSESVGIVWMLMEIDNPDSDIIAAVNGAIKWLNDNKMEGYRVERTYDETGKCLNTKLVADDTNGPLWGRFYDLDSCTIYVCDRDGIPRRSLEEIGLERRNGYGWYNQAALCLYEPYCEWCKRYGVTPVIDHDF